MLLQEVSPSLKKPAPSWPRRLNKLTELPGSGFPPDDYLFSVPEATQRWGQRELPSPRVTEPGCPECGTQTTDCQAHEFTSCCPRLLWPLSDCDEAAGLSG